MPALLRYSLCLLITLFIFGAGYLSGQQNQTGDQACHRPAGLFNDAVKSGDNTLAVENPPYRPALLM